jgi:DNA-directed RNA polymerase subunit H (RpoH/RPB5)
MTERATFSGMAFPNNANHPGLRESPNKEQDPMTKNGLNTPAPAGVSTEAVPDFLKQYGEVGSENVTRNDMVLPRIGLIQALSPQIKRNDPAYIEGAQQGDIFNTVTSALYGASVYLVNCYFVSEVAVFKKRAAGGGFRGTFKNLTEAQNFINNHPEGADLEAIEQGLHYVLVLDEDKNPVTEAAIVFQSTKMKISRKWNSLIELSGKGGPRFGRIWKIGSCSEKNQKGEFFNYTVSPAGFITEAIAEPAMALYNAVKGGLKQVDRSETHEEVAADDIPY